MHTPSFTRLLAFSALLAFGHRKTSPIKESTSDQIEETHSTMKTSIRSIIPSATVCALALAAVSLLLPARARAAVVVSNLGNLLDGNFPVFYRPPGIDPADLRVFEAGQVHHRLTRTAASRSPRTPLTSSSRACPRPWWPDSIIGTTPATSPKPPSRDGAWGTSSLEGKSKGDSTGVGILVPRSL